MRLAHDGRDEVVVARSADEVARVLADPVELRALVDGLVHDDSTADRWVMARVRVGPVEISPAVDLDVSRDGRDLALRGTPASGHTPTWLDHRISARPLADDRSTIVTRWRVEVEVPGPQLLAGTLQMMLTSGARSIARQLAERLVERFSVADPT